MCGICGEIRFDDNSPNIEIIKLMQTKLVPRGPDDTGTFQNGPLAFGHQRLAIIDLSDRARQPMIDQELGLALVFNGTIYNYPELRTELSNIGYHFFSTGDTEVILKAYQEWGPSCVEHLHGMFAIAIWDLAEKTLFLSRDRFGIKPLYWTESNKFLRFASNMQAILACGDINTDLDPIALHQKFTLHGVVPAPRTILRKIKKLKPAHWLLLHEDGTRREHCYWQLKATRPAVPRSELEWITDIQTTLYNAVKSHNNIADVPVGILLSGGLDSSLLVGILADIGFAKIQTFTIGFDDQPEEQGNEFVYSDLVANHFATEHHKITISNQQVLTRLPEAVGAMSEPMFAQDAVGFYLLAEQVARNIKAVQSGQGADEVFAGYFWYQHMAALTSGSRLERFSNNYFDREHAEYLQMMMSHYHVPDPTSPLIDAALQSTDADEFMDAVLRLDVTTLIVDDPVKRVDNMTMAHSLEARVPFLDHNLVELAASCPPELKLRHNGKYLLKAIARNLLPDAVIDRTKGYFPVPALKYIRGPFLELVQDIFNSQAAKSRGLYNPVYLGRLLAEPDKHYTRIQGNKLWHCALLEYWLQMHI